jgi:predicted transcriptional regulator of viral defense system
MPFQIADVEGHTVHLCSGRNTWNLGKTNIEWNVQNEARVITLPSTTLERTLIDIAVRPSNVGGVANVLKMYRATDGSANIAIMAELLEAIGFIYPYRQAIGFLLDRTGLYPDKMLKCLENPPFEFDFYLGHAMTHT